MASFSSPCARVAAAALAALAALGSGAEAPGCVAKGLDQDAEAGTNHIGLMQLRSSGVRGGLARSLSDGKIQAHFLLADRNGDGSLNEVEATRFLNSLEDDRMDELARTFQPPNASEREAAIEAWEAQREKERKEHEAEMEKRKEAHEAEMKRRKEAHEAEMAKREKERKEHEAELKEEREAHEAEMKARREEEEARVEKERKAMEEEWEAREEERKAREAEIAANRSKLMKAAGATWDRCHGSFLIALDCTMIPAWEGGSNCVCDPNTCGRWFGWCMGEDTRPLYNYSIRREHLANLSRVYGSLSEVLPESSELASTLQVDTARSRVGRLFARADADGDQLISNKEAANLVKLASATAQDRAAFRKAAHRQPYDDYEEYEEEETVEERNARNNRRCKAAFQAALDCTMVPAFAGGAKCLCMGDACHNWLGQCAGLPRGTPSPEVRTNVQAAVEQAFDTAVASVSNSVEQVAAALNRPPRPAAAIVAPKEPKAEAAKKDTEAAEESSE